MEAARQDIGRLANHLVTFAKHMLEQAGEFFPLAAVISKDGEVTPVGVDLDTEEPGVSDVCNATRLALDHMRLADAARLTGLAFNVSIPAEIESPHRDGVQIDFSDGRNFATIYIPYQLKRAGFLGRKRVAEMSAPIVI